MTVIRRQRASDWKRGEGRPEEPAQETPAPTASRPVRRTRTADPAPAEPVKVEEPSKGDDGETMLDEDAILAEMIGDDKDPEIVRTARVIARFKAGATNRRSAIRAHCVECMGGAIQEVGRCQTTDCALFPFRMGENPFDARTIAAKAKAEAAQAEPEPTSNRRSRK